MEKKILLDFGTFSCKAQLFSTVIAERFYDALPCTVSLTTWGDEAYGTIEKNLGEENPVPIIPPGGLAYTNQGNYLCIFWGQTPAWSVEHIGTIADEEWLQLRGNPLNRVIITSI